MRVDSAWLQPLLGAHHEGDVSLAGLCSEAAMAESRRWFESAGGVAGQWRETHLLDFLRRCTDLGDAQILSIFDLLDPEGRGTIGFAEFYYLVLLLMALKEGQMKVFLYQRLDATCALLQVRARLSHVRLARTRCASHDRHTACGTPADVSVRVLSDRC